MSIIRTKNLGYKIKIKNDNNEVIGYKNILNDINIDINRGEFVAVLGQNGSGKSTFAKHLNALILPTEGMVLINGEDTSAAEELWKIRRQCGMVFQNPDNQIVGVTVEEDVAFGPENLGVSSQKIVSTVREVLQKVGMTKYATKSPNHLSGGQKQRVAIASSLAMKPECIILDEPTAMLDPKGRREVIEIVRQLNREEHMTIILITHNMEETIFADRIYVMEKGRPVMQGKPRDIFTGFEEIARLKLNPPQITELSYRLYQQHKISRCDILEVQEFVEQYQKDAQSNLQKDIQHNVQNDAAKEMTVSQMGESTDENEILRLEHVSYFYEKGTNMEVAAVSDVSLCIHENEFVGIAGHMGSGKSTLMQLMNGLIRQSSGKIIYKGTDISEKKFDKRKMHFGVGLVFQYPESQLFADTVIEDVMYGPINKGVSGEQARQLAEKALKTMEIEEEYFDKSPFQLSGGEMRRVAIAGVIAMEPDIIILDEPTAGLDPVTRTHLLQTLKRMYEESKKTIVMVSHSMEDIADYAKRIVVMDGGKIRYDDTVGNVFRNRKELEQIGLGVPQVTYAVELLRRTGCIRGGQALTVEEAMQIL